MDIIIDYEQLKKRCQQPENELIGNKKYRFFDNGGDVLAVAHVDVAPSITKYRTMFYQAENVTYSPSLDDRLGVYILMDLLPKLGLTFDLLLTTDEEIGQSTAQLFKTKKDYKWMFQFDRSGVDVVMYEYDTPANRRLLNQVGLITGIGSFSDICFLDFLGCTGFNFGTGYYNEHTLQCHMVEDDTIKMIKGFILFFNQNSDIFLDYNPVEYEQIAYTYGKQSPYLTPVHEETYDPLDNVLEYDDLGNILTNPDELCEYCNQAYSDLYIADLDCTLCDNCMVFLGL